MKKLLFLLLFIPLMSCSDDSENQSLRSYLTSNIFLDEYGNDGNLLFYKPLLTEGALYRTYEFRYNTVGYPCSVSSSIGETYEDCYKENPCAEQNAYLISEDDNQIVFGFSSDAQLIIRRQGNDMRLLGYNSAQETFDEILKLSSQSELNDAMATKNNVECTCNWNCN